jgi:hypothetical protein
MKKHITQIHPKNELVTTGRPAKVLHCLACGTTDMKPGRRYCSKECRQQIHWVLSLSKGLLRAFNVRYAAFSFTDNHVILDLLPVWSKEISRFMCKRTPPNKPTEDLKNLILLSGEEWHSMVNGNRSRSYASLHLLSKNNTHHIKPESIRPQKKATLRLSKLEKECMKILRLQRTDLSSDEYLIKIKTAYKRMAKLYHPDMGGDEEKFKKLNEANKQMLTWAENPQYTSRKALENSWSYDAATNRWSPPL